MEYQQLRRSVSELGRKCHQKIENITQKYESEINEMETEDLTTLTQHLCEMQNMLSIAERTRQKNKDILKSNDGSQLIDYKSKIDDFGKILPSLCITPPNFTPNQILLDILYQQFAILVATIKTFTEGYKEKIVLSDEDTIDTRLKDLRGVSCVGTEHVWISQAFSSDISFIDVHGSLKQSVTTKSLTPYDLTVTKQGHLVYTVWSFRGGGQLCLYLMRKRETETIITLQDWRPRGVCSTSVGDLLVCMTNRKASKVVRYHGSTVKQELMHNDKGHPLYGTGHLFITESTNKDVWVSDYKAKAIVVTAQSGKFKFRYTGNQESKKYTTFSPWCIDSDSQGHVLVVDTDNDCVHIIDNKGQLLCYIDNLSDPRGVSIDSNNCVLVGDLSGKVKVVKYLQ